MAPHAPSGYLIASCRETFISESRLPSQDLIAGATSVYTHRNVGRLSVECRQNSAGVAVEAILGSGVTDFANRFARDSGVIDDSIRGDFARNHH